MVNITFKVWTFGYFCSLARHMHTWSLFMRVFLDKGWHCSVSWLLRLFSCWPGSNPLPPRGLQHAELPCPSPSLWVMFLESVLLPNHLILCFPLLLLASTSPSLRGFSSESALCIGWPKYWSFSFSIRLSNEYSGLINPLGWTGWISLQFKGLSRVFPNTTVQKHQFFSAQASWWSSSHIHTCLWGKPQPWPDRPLSAKRCLCMSTSSVSWLWGLCWTSVL